MNVLYYWTEDGDPELCSHEDAIAKDGGLCYHCDNSIAAGAEISLLRPVDGGLRRMHRACADESSQPVNSVEHL